MWVHRGEILGYGALADLVMLAVVVAILARRAWLSISALALDERGYGQNHAARQRAADLVADGYHGFISGHTHHPELAATAAGFYANSGSCTSVVEGIGGRFGLPPAYVRNQQICWLELDGEKAELVTARVELPGATKMERFVARGHNPHSDTPVRVASWPAVTGPRRTRRPPARSPSSAIRRRSNCTRTRDRAGVRAERDRGIQTGQPRSAALASSMVSSAAGSASRRSSGIGSPLRTDRP